MRRLFRALELSLELVRPPFSPRARSLAVSSLSLSSRARRYVRDRGAYYKPSLAKRILAVVVPLVLPIIAWIPPAVLFTRSSQDYYASFKISEDITATLGEWGEDFQPGDKLDISKLAQLFVPGADLGNFLTNAARQARIGYAYVAGVLVITLLVRRILAHERCRRALEP